MSSSLKTCPHCNGLYERRVSGGTCPHCGKLTKTRFSQTEKKCPSCQHIFLRAASVNKQQQCPFCGVKIYVRTSNGKSVVILQEHKEIADKLVARLEEHISKRDETNFRFLPVDRRAQLHHAYALLQSAETFIGEQSERVTSSAELAQKAVDNALNNGYAAANSLLYLRSGMTKHFNGVWRGEVVLHKVNENNRPVNMSAYRVR